MEFMPSEMGCERSNPPPGDTAIPGKGSQKSFFAWECVKNKEDANNDLRQLHIVLKSNRSALNAR